MYTHRAAADWQPFRSSRRAARRPASEAAGINNLGRVVGFAQTSTDADHGLL